MALNFEFEFSYPTSPIIAVGLRSILSTRTARTGAHLDTGAEISLFDATIATRLELDLASGTPVSIRGVGGATLEARLITVELALLTERDLTITLPVAFATIDGLGVGNLIGLDVLEHFDFALSHSPRTGYLGRAP